MTNIIELYKKYYEAGSNVNHDMEYAPYDWYELPHQISANWFVYGQMLDEFSSGISDSINKLINLIYQLDSWSLAFNELSENDKFEASIEIVDTIATVALNLPYAIRSRFIFSTAHLCHQANQVYYKKNWKDDLPFDGQIDFNTADSYGKNWKSYKKLKKRLERVADNEFKKETHNFRNKYQHRFPPGIEVGLTHLMRRLVIDKGRVKNGFGGIEPLTFETIIPLLKNQYKACFNAISPFQLLIREQIEAFEQLLFGN